MAKTLLKRFLLMVFLSFLLTPLSTVSAAKDTVKDSGTVGVIDMDMMILPGTSAYLSKSIQRAVTEGAKLLIVQLDTPGGILQTSQEMIQTIFASPVPVVVYVGPEGATATSAGVFITLAAHVAVMAPGTSIGAAHPVAGDGKDIEGDMRAKAENMTIAMVKSISEQRGRNVEWAEKAVKESDSITEKEAVEKKVVDFVATDIDDLLGKLEGRKVTLNNKKITLKGLKGLTVVRYDIALKDKLMNVLANPNIAALLWLGATTGLSLELYHPGAILPGVVGVICLILALAVSQIIPVTQSGVLLLAVGAVLIGAELYVASGILGIGGVIAIVLGAIYLIDVSQAPGLAVSMEMIVPVALLIGGCLLYIVRIVVRDLSKKSITGQEGMLGIRGNAVGEIKEEGRVFLEGEYWNVVNAHPERSILDDEEVEVVEVLERLRLKVKKVD